MKSQSLVRGRAALGFSLLMALFVAFAPPVAYFLNSYRYLLGSLDAQAEVSSRTVSGVVTANPKTWLYESVRLSELLERRPLSLDPQERRIVDLKGGLVAEHVDQVDPPKLARSVPIYDAGATVARVEVVQSVLPLLRRSVAIGIFSLLAGIAVYVYFGVHYRKVGERALAALEDSERRHRSVYQSMREGMILFRWGNAARGEQPLVIVDVNPALAAMLGVGREEALATPLGSLFGGALAKRMDEIALAESEGGGFEVEGRQEESGRVYSISVFFPEAGLIAALIEDLTEIRKAQEERDQLERSMLQAQKLESLGVLAGGIAHDFNNLLAGIMGNVDLAQSVTPADSPSFEYLKRVERSALRASELTNQMLAYSGRGRFVVERIDLSKLVGEMGHLLSTVVAKSARIEYRLEGNLPLVEADATQVRQVVMNLITNASDAMEGRAGTITVSTRSIHGDRKFLNATRFGGGLPEGEYVCVAVADEGCGMDPSTRERIFDPFFTTKQKGRGLGLAAVLGIVRGHKGTFTVESEPGVGSTIKICFPTVDGVYQPIEQAEAENINVQSPAPEGAILVVDDEDDVRELVRDILESNGYRVMPARDGREAVELFRRMRGEIAAVVLDMTMPVMSGGEAFTHMRQIAPEVPVILSSGYAELEHPELVAQAAGFIQKPYRVKALLDVLAEVRLGGGIGCV